WCRSPTTHPHDVRGTRIVSGRRPALREQDHPLRRPPSAKRSPSTSSARPRHRPGLKRCCFFFSSRRRHTRLQGDWSSDVCSSDLIVVVENVERQLENGLAPLAAAKAAMREVTGPIMATTAVLAAVFVPVAFLPGVTGRLYNQFALTIAVSVAISAFDSLPLSPALCAVMLRHRVPSRFIPFRAFNAGFSRVMRTYANAIRHLIGARWLVLTLFAIGLALTYGLYTRVPTGFLPVADQGYFFAV